MSTLGERLREARKAAKYAGPAEAARALGMNRFTYTQHENGLREFKKDTAARYARRFQVNFEWLYLGRGEMRPGHSLEVPLTHYVGAGAEVYPFSDQGALDFIEVPAIFQNCEGAVIRGDSMLPLQDGWIILWTKEPQQAPDDLVGKLCVARVKDGGVLLKILRRSTKKTLWALESWNAPLRQNVQIEWVVPVVDIRPR